MVEELVELSVWTQMILMVGLMLLARRIALRFTGIQSWRDVWALFAIGFFGMFLSRILVILIAYEVTPWWILIMNRYVSPLITGAGLFFGMLRLDQLLKHLPPMPTMALRGRAAGIQMDAHSRITHWDNDAEWMFGLTAEQAIGNRVPDLMIPPRDRDRHDAGVARHLVDGGATTLNAVYWGPAMHPVTREEFPVEVVINIVPQEGHPPLFAATVRRL